MKKDFFRRFIVPAALGLAAVAFLNGYFLPEELSKAAREMFQNYLKGISFTIWGILLNNLVAALVLFAGGFLLALPSLASFYVNFAILGIAFRASADAGQSLRFLGGVLPHGIFEIPAIVISFCLGLSVAAALIRRMTGKGRNEIRPALAACLRLFGLVVVPLLIAAAIIEVTVTPLVLRSF